MEINELPALNATLNAAATVFLLSGWICIKLKKRSAHATFMVLALIVSTAFLTSYLTFHWKVGHVEFHGKEKWVRVLYFVVLIPHIFLAFANVPLVLMTVIPAARQRFDKHKRMARWTLPVWLYVSVTGVIVYYMGFVWYAYG